MSRYRPKHYILYRYGMEYKAYIACYPQSKWELIHEDDKGVALTNKNITIHLAEEDFERNWVEVKQKERIC